jgi:hypothetical protein
MVQKTQTLIPLTDLNKLSFSCGKCHAPFFIDVGNKDHRNFAEAYERRCPICSERWPDSIGNACSKFFDFLMIVEKSKLDFTFVLDSPN